MDTPESLALDLLKAAAEAVVGTRVIVQASAQTIKTQARVNVRKSAPVHNAHAADAITFETGIDRTGGAINAEIGYDKDRPGGSLGNLLEYGGGGDKSPAHRDIGRAADTELPQFETALATFAGKLL